MKKNRLFVILAGLAMLFVLSACGAQPLVVEPSIKCDTKKCTVTVKNKEQRDVAFSLRVWGEDQGMKMVPTFKQYANERQFKEWVRPNLSVFNVNDVIPSNEMLIYSFDIPQGSTGQTLFTVNVGTEAPHGLSTDYGNYFSYATVGRQESDDVIYTITCDDQLDVTIYIPENSSYGNMAFAVYVNEDVTTPFVEIVAKNGDPLLSSFAIISF